MLYRITTAITLLGCIILLILIFLEQYKGFTVPVLKPLLWITIAAFLTRVIIRARSNKKNK